MSGGIDFSELERAAARHVETGLTALQVAVARGGEILWSGAFGSATPATRFWIASATKPLFQSAMLHLIADGRLEVERPVVDFVPEFGTNGKEVVTVEQVLLMTSGFPDAPIAPQDGGDHERRIARFRQWRLDWEPGTRYAYHGMSAHWVLAEIVERISGQDFRDFVEERVTRPLGLPRVLGVPRSEQADVAQLSEAADEQTRTELDYATKIEVGEPGGGAVMNAEGLALFYQALLHNPGELWDPPVLADALTNVRCTLSDPVMRRPANRTLAVVVGAGFGSFWGSSQTAFGWAGYGGHLGCADPATGISFAVLQMGDNDQLSQFARTARLTHRALDLGR